MEQWKKYAKFLEAVANFEQEDPLLQFEFEELYRLVYRMTRDDCQFFTRSFCEWVLCLDAVRIKRFIKQEVAIRDTLLYFYRTTNIDLMRLARLLAGQTILQ